MSERITAAVARVLLRGGAKTGRRNAAPEHDIHVAIVAQVFSRLPSHWVHFPVVNEQAMRRFVPDGVWWGVKRKLDARGLLPGVADHLVFGDAVGFAFEVKTPRGRLSPDQKTFLTKIGHLGVITAVVRSPAEAEEILVKHGVALQPPLFGAAP